MKATLTTFIVIASIVWLGFVGWLGSSMLNDYEQYKKENVCIAKYIQKGIDRANIIRDNGTCKIK